MPPRAATVRLFSPESWGQVELFSNLCSETYRFNEREQRALAGVRQHFEKAAAFQSLAFKIRPSIAIDRKQLEEHGFTPAANSRELGIAIEAAIQELYSSIDCTVKVLFSIYGARSRGFKNSTRGLFKNFERIQGDFPATIKDSFRSAAWYEQLRFLRDELTHLGVGSCYLDESANSISYMHVGIKTDGKPLIIGDVFAWLANLMDAVNTFLGEVFRCLRSTLKDTPVVQFCGLVEGRMLMRYVNPREELTFASGQCFSYQWFEKPDAPTCPFAVECGAYARTRPTINPTNLITDPKSGD